ncbi:LYR motif-containing protein 4 [Zootermopsis nevadensis]|uniref:LYR motif-containing protein 4 n=1 Tax=Zootermopsis nevadensis TaxID=136037 RepID=A0A067RAW7_ZOONE|nr:LYR motif-containing protein 4 [Zootermopsis nevadensis]KDR15786.1 LYR motif-containing protein 4 [Zootermopsis nevadensis]
MAISKNHVLKLYKTMLRESEKFSSYNYRLYALRRVRDTFKDGKSLTDSTEITEAVHKAEETLEIIKRQVVVGNLYAAEKLVIEKKAEKELTSRQGIRESCLDGDRNT